MEFFGFYFDFSGFFPDLIPLKGKKGLFNSAGPAKLIWHATCDRATRAHVDAYVAPTWREE